MPNLWVVCFVGRARARTTRFLSRELSFFFFFAGGGGERANIAQNEHVSVKKNKPQ